MAPKLTLYVDVLSPFAYLSFYSLRHSPSLSELPITYIPVFLSGIMALAKNSPPLACPKKGAYTITDLNRHARRHGIPLTQPKQFPVKTLFAMRCCAALQMLGEEEKLLQLLEGLYETYWGNGISIADEGAVRGVLVKVLGEEMAEKVAALAGKEEAKKQLDENTAKVVEAGCFGLPWFVVEKEGKEEAFWGFERLAEVVRECGFVWKEGEERIFGGREDEARL
jgi:2-hydroxychromene-2-carboxylate isomerase